MKLIKEMISAYLAGIAIFLGSMIYLSVDNKIIGSLLFSIGLFFVCTMGLGLFTGRICYCLDSNRRINLVLMPIIWIMNFVGAISMASLIKYARIITPLAEGATRLCDVKLYDSDLSLFILGIICNIFIFIGVHEYKYNPHDIGKYLGIILAVMGFILVGSEHCVADMCYIAIAGYYTKPMLYKLLIITLGNAVGGIGINMLFNIKYNIEQKEILKAMKAKMPKKN